MNYPYEVLENMQKQLSIGAVHERVEVVSPLLRRVLVCISYQWNVQKLVYLESMINMIASYETDISILIVTDDLIKVNTTLSRWGYADTVRLWQAADDPLCATVDHPTCRFSLLWEHKAAVREEIASSDYTAVVYLEDDTHLTWGALTSWALDTEILQPLNFTRCIYRTEISPHTGHPVAMDWVEPVSVEVHGRSIDVSVENPSTYEEVSRRVAGRMCGPIREGGKSRPCTVHRYFLNPTRPFQGMWIATRKQLDAYIASPYWEKMSALFADVQLEDFDYPERSNSLHILVNVPNGYPTSCMVPYLRDGDRFKLAPGAEVYHMRNGYSTDPLSRHGKLEVNSALLP